MESERGLRPDCQGAPGPRHTLTVMIETDRLQLRPLTMADLDDLIAIHAKPEVQRFFGPLGRAELIDWLALVEKDWAQHGYGRAAIVDRVTGRLLGRAGLKRLAEFGETELGWVLHPDAWGKRVRDRSGTRMGAMGLREPRCPVPHFDDRPAQLEVDRRRPAARDDSATPRHSPRRRSHRVLGHPHNSWAATTTGAGSLTWAAGEGTSLISRAD